MPKASEQEIQTSCNPASPQGTPPQVAFTLAGGDPNWVPAEPVVIEAGICVVCEALIGARVTGRPSAPAMPQGRSVSR